MAGPKSKNATYRDDPDAVSLHTTPDDVVQYSDDVAELPDHNSSSSSASPPTYSEATFYNDPDRERFAYDGLNVRETHFAEIGRTSHIFQKNRTLRISGEHVNLQYAPADSDHVYLQQWVEYMSRRAPTPYIVVRGTHSELRRESDGKDKRVEVTDFQIRVNIRNYLWPNFRADDPTMMTLRTADNGDKTWRGTVLKHRAPGAKGGIEVGEIKPTLEEWCQQYCSSKSRTRLFRLTRVVTGFDEDLVRSRLSCFIRATNYKGHLDISFPVADRAVDIYSTSLLNNWRLITWVRWVFYLTFLWIFAWPILYFTTKRYNIVKAEWAFSQADAHGNRRYTTVSEEQWVDKFGPAVQQLAKDRYDGVVGDDMLNQVLARPETHRPVPAEFRGAQAAFGAAVEIARGGSNPLNQVSNLLRFAGGTNDEVGWGYDT